jgi:N-acetylmuramoyl-L-alanine amidase
MINNALSQSFGDRSEGVTVRGVKKAPFFVLVGAHMPCTLLELLFVDHHMDAKRLAQPKFRERAARAIVRGIASFFGDGIVKSPLPREKIQNEKSGGKKVGDPQKKVGTVKGSNEGKKRRTRGR